MIFPPDNSDLSILMFADQYEDEGNIDLAQETRQQVYKFCKPWHSDWFSVIMGSDIILLEENTGSDLYHGEDVGCEIFAAFRNHCVKTCSGHKVGGDNFTSDGVGGG